MAFVQAWQSWQIQQLCAALQVKAFINEAHYYADATLMFPVWPPITADNSSTTLNQCEGSTKPRQDTNWGLRLAEQLWQEVLWRSTHL